MWGHHAPADPTGPGVQRARQLSTRPTTDVPLSQVGINDLANQTGHLGVSINFTWMLMCGFLVLFMQVGFAFLVTGLDPGEERGAHDDDEHRRVRGGVARVLRRSGSRSSSAASAPIANLGGTAPLNGIFGHGSAGIHRHARLLAAEPRHATTSA